MDPVFALFLSCILTGAIVGFLAGLLGIGGGVIVVPTLVFLFASLLNIDIEHGMPMAVATSLSTVIFTGLSSAKTHYKLGNLDSRIVLYVAIGISLGAVGGALFATNVSGVTLQKIFAVLLALIALQMAFLKRPVSENQISKPKLTGIGGGAGFIAALMGIGGGALIVPALVWFQVNIKKAIGCASFCGVVIASVATITFIIAGYNKAYLPSYSVGYVYLPALLGIVLTSIFTAPIGARMTDKLDTKLLKKIFAGFLMIVSIRMLIGLD